MNGKHLLDLNAIKITVYLIKCDVNMANAVLASNKNIFIFYIDAGMLFNEFYPINSSYISRSVNIILYDKIYFTYSDQQKYPFCQVLCI